MPPYLEEQTAGRSWGVGRCNPGPSHFSESVRTAGRTLILSVIAVALLVSRSTAVLPMREVRRVLVINDLGVISSPGFAEVDQAVLAGLQKSPYRIELYEESLDLTLFPDRVSQDRFREEIIQKYSARKPDVIIAAGPVSLKFIAKLYDKFQGTPVIFCAIWGGIPDQLRHGMPFTGVLAQLDPEGTLNAALHLLPSTKHVVVVGGVGKFDQGFEAIVKQSFHNYESKLEFKYLFDLTMPALLERLKHLPSDTIVYHTAISQDAAGDRFVDSAQSIPMVTSAANAPVFVIDDVDLRAGTVGGDLVNWADDGRIAAEMAARVLNGEKPQDIPVVTSNHAYMFDWRALKRWGMNEKNLPPGSIVLNRQPTIWESYKWYVISGIALILSEALLIGGLVWQRAELKGSEERHRVIVEAASDAVISMDENGGILLANPATARIFGYDPVELIGKPLTVVMPEFMRKLHQSGFRRYLATGERHLNGQGTEVIALRKNGQEFPAEVSFGEITSSGHKVFTGFIRDISEKKRAEDELRSQKEVFQKIFENIPVTISFVARDGRIELVNPEWERTLGWTLEEIRKQKLDLFAEFYPDLDLIAASTGEWTDRKVRVRDGRVIDLSVAAVHLSDGTSVAIGRDVTELKCAEEALRDAQAELALVTRVLAMGELVASIAHEIYQPLTAILTTGNFVLRQLANTPNLRDVHDAIREIVEDAERVSAVISRVRAQLSRNVPDRVELDINAVIQEVTVLIRSETAQNQVHLELDLGKGLAHVMGDRVQLQQVLINLIVNAIDAMRSVTGRPRNLDITSAKHAGGVLVRVQDSGTGVDPNNVERIFDPFFTTKRQGTGMGLSISRSIIESHGGRLWVEPGSSGAIFQFTLPAKESRVS